MSFHPMDAGLKGILSVGPVALVLVSAFHVDEVAGVVVLLVSVGAFVGIVLGLGVRISETRDAVVISLLPFWRSRLAKVDVDSIDVAEVWPFEDFGGWGIKGRARGNGLLYSAGGSTVVRFTMVDGRRYLASVAAGSADRVVDALHGNREIAP